MRSIARLLGSVFALLAALAGGDALAQAYPSKTVTLLVPYAPGGGHDAMARIVAEKLGPRLGQTVVVENKPGAAGMIGTEQVVRAAPDGYTLLFSSPAEIVVAPSVYKTMRYDPVKDLTPITQVGDTPLVLMAHPSVGVKTVAELIAKAKREPGKLSFGTAGTGSSQHLAGAWINNLAGIDLQHVPYKGAGPATNDLLGGNVPLGILGMAPVLKHIQAGRIVALAVMTPKRVDWAKDTPTVAETPGMEGFQANHWMGLLGPAGMPPEVVAKLQGEVAAVLAMPEVRERLRGLGIDPVGSSTEDFRRFLAEERERFAKMFKLTGLKQE
ncbi:MAG TPA: tripartite tricarboxylate transporter substrate binding protein [Usitatibacteraceae bacterium]|nr:tripartite tricarboxylate transporter substrate binding protein [Usitatibacteraceae bacterium]